MNLHEFLHSETTIRPSDVKYLAIASCVFAIYRVVISNFLIKPFSLLVAEKQRSKFVHRGFDAIHYITSTILGLLAMSQRPYAHCLFYYLDCGKFLGCSGTELICSVLEKVYYFYFTSYYISDLLWLKTNKEVFILLFHHTMTLSLLCLTITSFSSVVSMPLMLLHDCGDFFLYIGKVTSYLGIKKVSDAAFVLFAISFFYFRWFVCASLGYTIIHEDVRPKTNVTPYLFGKWIFCGLFSCHVIWGYTIIKALIKIFKGEPIRDTRSDKIAEATKEKAN